MNLRKYSLAASLLAAVGFTHNTVAWDPSTTPDYIFNISGASAQQTPLESLLNSFCQAGTLDTYESNGNQTAYFCTFLDSQVQEVALPTQLNEAKVLINHRVEGGSVWGVIPVARNRSIEFLNIFRTSNQCTDNNNDRTWDCPIATRAATAPFGSSGNFECPLDVEFSAGPVYSTPALGPVMNAHVGTSLVDTVCLQGKIGVSDVEPALFAAGANDPGFPGGSITDADILALESSSQYGVIFGVAITDNAYKFLQELQFGDGTPGNPNVYTDEPAVLNPGTPGASNNPAYAAAIQAAAIDLDPNKVPSLPKAAAASMLASGSSLGSFQDLEQSIAPVTPLFNAYTVCRRVVGSGTQASANAFLMGDPCLGSAGLTMWNAAPAGGATSTFDGVSRVIVNNSGSSDVEDCLNGAIEGQLANLPKDAVKLPFNLPAMDAIGFNAISKTRGTNSPWNDQWNYIRIDGVAPTVPNAAAGLYPFVFEQTIQYNVNTADTVDIGFTNVVAIASGLPATTPANNVALGSAFDYSTADNIWRGGRDSNSCRPVQFEADTSAEL